MDKAKLKKYGKSAKGNFYPIDTIGVPHPYCITPRHVGWASDHHSGMLGADAIMDAEKNGHAVCDTCKGKLSWEEHKQAILIECKKDIKDNKELKDYLLKIKDKAIKDKFEGFAFKKADDFKE